MLTSQLEAIIAVNGMPEDQFERAEPIIPGNGTVSLSFGWFTPIYTRTLDDCVYGNPIGCIDIVLLNRLEANTDYLSRLCLEYHVLVDPQEPKDEVWQRTMYVYYADLLRIRNNITRLRNSGYIESSTPKAPLIAANGYPTYADINAWEKCLYDIRTLIKGSQTNLQRPLGTFSMSTKYWSQFIRR